MNYNIPYYNMFPLSNVASMPLRSASGGIFKRIFGGFNIGSLLNNTQKTLNLVNQAIPIVKQINPLVKNAKTMFRVMNEFKRMDDSPLLTSNTVKQNSKIETIDKENSVSNNVNDNEGPIFFVT